jgi:hypothetical protein
MNRMDTCMTCGAAAVIHVSQDDGDTSWIASPYTPEHVALIAALWKSADAVCTGVTDYFDDGQLQQSVEALRPLFGEEQS